MKTPTVILLLLGLVMARGEPASNRINQLETKNIPQVVKPTTVEAASTRNEDLKVAHMKYQVDRVENAHNQDMNVNHHSQLQNSHFYDPNLAAQFLNQNQASQFRGQGQSQQFSNQRQTQQIHSQGQAIAGSSLRVDQEVSSLLQSQQRITPAAVTTIQSETKDQMHDFTAQQLYSGNIHPQEEFYHDRRTVSMGVQDQHPERSFSDPTNRQTQAVSGFQSMENRAGSISQVHQQRSGFDNREQPIVLPHISHSSSVVVSGLKNLPVLPALVYSAGAVPSSHALAYSRPWHQGGAYVRQHWQTPFARYVYTHIL